MACPKRHDPWSDPLFYQYDLFYQVEFILRQKARGPRAHIAAQRLVSKLRIMRRRAIAGKNPSLSHFRWFTRAHRGNFVKVRSSLRFLRLLEMGESHRSLHRRGYFGGIKDFETYRSLVSSKLRFLRNSYKTKRRFMTAIQRRR